jgi:hypothetical protein
LSRHNNTHKEKTVVAVEPIKKALLVEKKEEPVVEALKLLVVSNSPVKMNSQFENVVVKENEPLNIIEEIAVERGDELDIKEVIAVELGDELKIDEDIDFTHLGIKDTENDKLLPEIDYSDLDKLYAFCKENEKMRLGIENTLHVGKTPKRPRKDAVNSVRAEEDSPSKIIL